MRVRLEHRFERHAFDVTFYDDFGASVCVLRPVEGDSWLWEPVDPGSQPAPSLSIPAPALEALLVEAGKVIPATHATERHLTDTVAVRDRLLALVEEAWKSP